MLKKLDFIFRIWNLNTLINTLHFELYSLISFIIGHNNVSAIQAWINKYFIPSISMSVYRLAEWLEEHFQNYSLYKTMSPGPGQFQTKGIQNLFVKWWISLTNFHFMPNFNEFDLLIYEKNIQYCQNKTSVLKIKNLSLSDHNA